MTDIPRTSFDIKMAFILLCYFQMFFLMVWMVLLMNNEYVDRKDMGVTIVRMLFVALGIFSATHASSKGLVLYILAQIVSAGFELEALIANLTTDSHELCDEHRANETEDVVVKEKLYSFALLSVACVAAHKLRNRINTPPMEEYSLQIDEGQGADS